jgi:hypothetical protein
MKAAELARKNGAEGSDVTLSPRLLVITEQPRSVVWADNLARDAATP